MYGLGGTVSPAGPTFLPHGAEVLPSAVHMSDVSFFWEAPANASFSRVPWAISANFAFRNSARRCGSSTSAGVCSTSLWAEPMMTWMKVLEDVEPKERLV